MYNILREGDRGQQKAAMWGRWPAVGGFEPAIPAFKSHDLSRLTTAVRDQHHKGRPANESSEFSLETEQLVPTR